MLIAARFVPNLTPICATILAIREESECQPVLRRYLQCHITGEIEFLAVRTQHEPTFVNGCAKHTIADYKFEFEFHLSYVALRHVGAGKDPRGLRDHITMIEPLDATVGSQQDLICYDAATSCVVFGKNDSNWKSYCNVETWFDSEHDVQAYLDTGRDGPSGGARLASEPCWNPREYFLLVLCRRLMQLGMEWGHLSTVLMERLNTYVCQRPTNNIASPNQEKSKTKL